MKRLAVLFLLLASIAGYAAEIDPRTRSTAPTTGVTAPHTAGALAPCWMDDRSGWWFCDPDGGGYRAVGWPPCLTDPPTGSCLLETYCVGAATDTIWYGKDSGGGSCVWQAVGGGGGGATGALTVTMPPYNALCNGTGDDTAAINSALAAGATQHKPVRIPPGGCRVTGTLSITAPVSVVGDFPSPQGSEIVCANANGCLTVSLTPADHANEDRVLYMRDIQLRQDVPLNSTKALMEVSAANQVRFERVQFETGSNGINGIGLAVKDINYASLHDCYWSGGGDSPDEPMGVGLDIGNTVVSNRGNVTLIEGVMNRVEVGVRVALGTTTNVVNNIQILGTKFVRKGSGDDVPNSGSIGVDAYTATRGLSVFGAHFERYEMPIRATSVDQIAVRDTLLGQLNSANAVGVSIAGTSDSVVLENLTIANAAAGVGIKLTGTINQKVLGPVNWQGTIGNRVDDTSTGDMLFSILEDGHLDMRGITGWSVRLPYTGGGIFWRTGLDAYLQHNAGDLDEAAPGALNFASDTDTTGAGDVTFKAAGIVGARLRTIDICVDGNGTTIGSDGTSCSGNPQGATLVQIDVNTLDLDGNNAADNVELCTDSLTAPTQIASDGLSVGCMSDGGDGTVLRGAAPATATLSVTNAWAFYDTDGDGLLDNGEDLYIDAEPTAQYRSIPPWAVLGDVLASGKVGMTCARIGSSSIDGASACLCRNASDQIYHDQDCDSVQDAGELPIGLYQGAEWSISDTGVALFQSVGDFNGPNTNWFINANGDGRLLSLQSTDGGATWNISSGGNANFEGLTCDSVTSDDGTGEWFIDASGNAFFQTLDLAPQTVPAWTAKDSDITTGDNTAGRIRWNCPTTDGSGGDQHCDVELVSKYAGADYIPVLFDGDDTEDKRLFLGKSDGDTNVYLDGFKVNIVASTCTTDGNLGALTIVGNEIVCSADNGGAGSSAILDLGDDAVNESTGIVEIATTGDTNSVFTEPAADKLLINLANDWPKADTCDDLTCTDCIGTPEIADSYVLNSGDQMTGALDMEAQQIQFQGGSFIQDTTTLVVASDAGARVRLDINGDGTNIFAIGHDATNKDAWTWSEDGKTFKFCGVDDVACVTETLPEPAAAQAWSTPDPGDDAIRPLIDCQGTPCSAEVADGNLPKFSGTGGLLIDSGVVAANVSQLGPTIGPTELLSGDFGDWSCNGTTCSLDTGYLPLAGGTLTGQLGVDNLGLEFEESATNPTCAAGNFNIFANATTFKKCINGTLTDLDTGGGVTQTEWEVTRDGATCIATTGIPAWNVAGTNGAGASCYGSVTTVGTLDFDPVTSENAYHSIELATGWTGTLDADIVWIADSATTTETARLCLATACVATDEVFDPSAFNTASCLEDDALSVAFRRNIAALTSVAVTGCAVGETMHLKLYRDIVANDDMNADDARILKVVLKMVRDL